MSIAFLIAIPTTFFLGSMFLFASILSYGHAATDKEIWQAFAAGIALSILLFSLGRFARLRTFIHELKHTVVVVLSGNKMKDFHVAKDTGHVSYAMYEDRLHFESFVALAPYFVPLFSFPTLVLCLLLEDFYRLPLSFGLGIALGADLITAWGELHPNQSDLKKIFGGFLLFGAFIGGANFMWAMACLLWISAGRNGFFLAFALIWQLAGQVFRNWEGSVRR